MIQHNIGMVKINFLHHSVKALSKRNITLSFLDNIQNAASQTLNDLLMWRWVLWSRQLLIMYHCHTVVRLRNLQMLHSASTTRVLDIGGQDVCSVLPYYHGVHPSGDFTFGSFVEFSLSGLQYILRLLLLSFFLG